MSAGRPAIDVVIIGLNSAKTLEACISSVRAAHYPAELLHIIYADGGSSDGSQDLATRLGVRVVEVLADTPTPGRQRNGGWRAGSAPLVQFLDSDTLLDPDWLERGTAALADGVGAVNGDRRELYPEQTLFNWLGDQEWNGPAGEAEAFGGDVLIRRVVLETTGGYNDHLIAGEDPEFSHRVRLAGWKLIKLPVLMTRHDLAMKTLKQYWKRAHRTGHAYAEVNRMHPDFWRGEARRILLRTGILLAGLACGLLAWLSPWLLVPAILALLLFLRPRLTLAGRFARTLGLTNKQAGVYAWHATLVVVPQFFGLLRFHWGRLTGRPLTNKKVLNTDRRSA